MDPNYATGFEDAVEFCLAAAEDAQNKDELVKKITDYLALVHETKFEKIRTIFGIYFDLPKPEDDEEEDGEEEECKNQEQKKP